jgi:zinc transport system substrate-binding protein
MKAFFHQMRRLNQKRLYLQPKPHKRLRVTLRIIELAVIILIPLWFGQSGLAADRVLFFVSISPQKFFVQQIGKDLVTVEVMVQPGASPATYEPKPGQMAALSKARAYFAIGVPFENAWLEKIAAANPGMRVVHTDDGVAKIPMADHRHDETDAHHEPDAGGQRGLDPHIWLSPPLVKIQARTIRNTLQEMDPAHRAVYQNNYQQLNAQIDWLDEELRTIFAGKQGLQFMVFHPSWGYFARAYGLKQVAVEIEGKDPKPAQLRALIEYARERDINIIFVQPQFPTKSAQLVAREIDGQVAFADPLSANWLTNLREVANKFKAALR